MYCKTIYSGLGLFSPKTFSKMRTFTCLSPTQGDCCTYKGVNKKNYGLAWLTADLLIINRMTTVITYIKNPTRPVHNALR